MDHIRKKQKIDNSTNIEIAKNVNSFTINTKELYDIDKKSLITNSSNCILCNVYIGEENPGQLCNKISCFNS
jgi:hypothetical protein